MAKFRSRNYRFKFRATLYARIMYVYPLRSHLWWSRNISVECLLICFHLLDLNFSSLILRTKCLDLYKPFSCSSLFKQKIGVFLAELVTFLTKWINLHNLTFQIHYSLITLHHLYIVFQHKTTPISSLGVKYSIGCWLLQSIYVKMYSFLFFQVWADENNFTK